MSLELGGIYLLALRSANNGQRLLGEPTRLDPQLCDTTNGFKASCKQLWERWQMEHFERRQGDADQWVTERGAPVKVQFAEAVELRLGKRVNEVVVHESAT
eukprot:GEZU01019089.1.p4 GENE.GEZU01019089.1~~GEZU01019089.1.p4  ORF type:complete len:101 (-),score=14.89 GEZU01019089.1:1450-1752(-)